MDSYKQYIQQILPDLPIYSYKQNENGWDNVAVIINEALLFRFPRKSEYAKRIPLEKELCAILAQSLQATEVPNYHLLYTNDSDSVPFCSYYTLIHGDPLTAETVAKLERKEREIIITQLATFLATLHSIPIKCAEQLGFIIEKTITYWKHLQSKLYHYLSHSFTLLERQAVRNLFHNFFELMHDPNLENTVIHADFTHHHILFDEKSKAISGIIDFGDAQIGDPALDFAGLYYDFGNEFTKAVYKQYCALIPHRDPLFTRRITDFYQYSPLLHNLIYSFETNNEREIKKDRESLRAILQGLN
ncbi:aminoglycoside phosphotransferase family protein [Bacillus clarus]|uniref:Aminoglycoside phosphotransferase family protein n=1 Tax=Bacillus clarus TaxID=2338372 RepID=A0A090YMZ9_9BACI|nr:aminoglycoside phosphotransferase family protein [Bacillus clarus]KFM99571.1 phosphotransferase enzyme family protein [Bacillus clarus]RFT68251.1 aminoglycoside phosphotransferase family protein [Bacillus clarus]